MVINARFIAGAVCPSCQTMDSIKQHIGSEEKHIECVSCGYIEQLNGKPGKNHQSSTEKESQLIINKKTIDKNSSNDKVETHNMIQWISPNE